MKNIRTQALLLAALVALGLGTSCVEEQGALLIIHNEAITSAQSCEAQPALDGTFLSRGTMDVMLTNRYVMFPTVLNQMKRSEDVSIGVTGAGAGGAGGGGGGGGGGGAGGTIDDVRVEANTVSLEGATVSFSFPPGLGFESIFPAESFIPTSGSVQPDSVATAGLEVISVAAGTSVRTSSVFWDAANNVFRRGAVVTVLATVKFQGTTSSGRDVESNEFSFPLDICAGCLLRYAPGTIFQDTDGSQTCEEALAGDQSQGSVTPEPVVIPCLVGQDEGVDCRLCRTLTSEPDELCDPPNP